MRVPRGRWPLSFFDEFTAADKRYMDLDPITWYGLVVAVPVVCGFFVVCMTVRVVTFGLNAAQLQPADLWPFNRDPFPDN